MKKVPFTNISVILTFLALLIVCIPGQSIAVENNTKSIDTSSEVLLVEGKVKQFNTESQTILLQLKDGEKITILVDWNTTLVGYTSSTEIEKGNKVKIWQSTTDGTATAVKIEKKLMVVC